EKLAQRFFVIGNLVLLDECDEVLWLVARQSRPRKVRIRRKEILRRAMNIREVAAPAAGDQNFLSNLFRAFEDGDTTAAFSSLTHTPPPAPPPRPPSSVSALDLLLIVCGPPGGVLFFVWEISLLLLFFRAPPPLRRVSLADLPN